MKAQLFLEFLPSKINITNFTSSRNFLIKFNIFILYSDSPFCSFLKNKDYKHKSRHINKWIFKLMIFFTSSCLYLQLVAGFYIPYVLNALLTSTDIL